MRTVGGFWVRRTQMRVAMPSMPSLPTKVASQVEPGRLGILTAEHGDRAVGQHHLDRQDVRRGDAVGEAVRPTGVGRHVPADRAALLARRVRRVVEAVGRELAAEVEVQDPGSTQASRDSTSTESTRFIFVVTITTASSSGTAPPARPVPEPRATNGHAVAPGRSHARLHLLRRGREAHHRRARPPCWRRPGGRDRAPSLPVRTRSGPERGAEIVGEPCVCRRGRARRSTVAP